MGEFADVVVMANCVVFIQSTTMVCSSQLHHKSANAVECASKWEPTSAGYFLIVLTASGQPAVKPHLRAEKMITSLNLMEHMLLASFSPCFRHVASPCIFTKISFFMIFVIESENFYSRSICSKDHFRCLRSLNCSPPCFCGANGN